MHRIRHGRGPNGRMTTPAPSDAGASGAARLPAPARNSIRRQLFWLAAGFILVSGALAAFTLAYLRKQAIEAGERLTESFALVIAEQTSSAFQSIDQRLQLAAGGIGRPNAGGGLKEAPARERLREQVKELPFVRAMWVMDAQGRTVYDSDPGSIGLYFGDRAYFQIFLTQPQTTFHIGAPVRSRTTGAWLISAARSLRSTDGAFAGVIVAALEPSYFDQLWRKVDLGAGGSIALFRRDGVLMMRSPFDDAAMGKTFPDLPVFRQPLETDPAGRFRNASAFDGVFRMFAYRTLSSYPELIAVVGRSYEVLLAPWRQLAAVALTLWAAASLAIIILSMFLSHAWQQGVRSEARGQHMAERLALATDATSIAVWDWDVGTGKMYASPSYFTMLGYDTEERVPGPEQWLERVHPEDRGLVAEKMQAALDGADAPYHYEARMQHADGSFRWVSSIGSVLGRDKDGKATRHVGGEGRHHGAQAGGGSAAAERAAIPNHLRGRAGMREGSGTRRRVAGNERRGPGHAGSGLGGRSEGAHSR